MALRLATFNLENLDEPAKKGGVPLSARLDVLRPQLLALRADVLCLQEVSAHARRGGHHELRALDRLLEGTPYASFERASTRGDSGGPSDKHNLVVLSRLPILRVEQHWHDIVEPPTVHLTTTTTRRDEHVRWDRPILEVQLDLGQSRTLTVFDVHLRAPLAAVIEGQKLAPLVWKGTSGWAEGYMLAAIKRVGQALELRRHVDRLFDLDPEARIVVAGDLNADVAASAFRMVCADVEDTGNPELGSRSLVPLEEQVPIERRYTVLHRGRRLLLDHILASTNVARGCEEASILVEGLEDEYELAVAKIEPVGSLHAPIVVALAIE